MRKSRPWCVTRPIYPRGALPTPGCRVKALAHSIWTDTYMRVPRTTVIRRLDLLQSWGLIDRRGCHYYLHEKTHSVVKNSLVLLSLFAGSTLSAAMRMGHNDRAV